MSPILHIFRKDIRQHWIEISASLILLAIYVWQQPPGGSVEEGIVFGSVSAFLLLSWKILPYLVPIAWCVLIIRTVQAESLVGDRQFWVTRPYRWPALLAEKCLLVLAFLNVPLFIADAILLDRDGFSIARYVTGLLFIQLLILLIVVLPVMTAAVITSTIPQVLFVALLTTVYFTCAATLTSYISASEVPASNPFSAVAGAIIVAAFLGIIFLQYARRKAWQSRGILLCAAALILILSVVTPYSRLVAKTYPLPTAGEQPLVHLAPGPTTPGAPITPPFPEARKSKYVQVTVPILVSGVEQGSLVLERSLRVDLNGPNGLRWNSGWEPTGGYLWPETEKSQLNVVLKRDLFERFKSTPAVLQLSLGVSQYRETDPHTIVAGSGTLSLPNDGRCVMTFARYEWTRCWAPLRAPSFIAVVNSSDSTCPANGSKRTIAAKGFAIGALWDDTPFAMFGISPIAQFPLNFGTADSPNVLIPADQQPQAPPICPGTPITFYSPQFSRASRVELTINQVRLGDLVVQSTRLAIFNAP